MSRMFSCKRNLTGQYNNISYVSIKGFRCYVNVVAYSKVIYVNMIYIYTLAFLEIDQYIYVNS